MLMPRGRNQDKSQMCDWNLRNVVIVSVDSSLGFGSTIEFYSGMEMPLVNQSLECF